MPLVTNRGADAGIVTVENSATEVSVVFQTSGDWRLSETHLHIASSLDGIPHTRMGRPKVEHFAHLHNVDPVSQNAEYTFALADLGYAPGDEVHVAAHAVVGKPNKSGNLRDIEGAWAGDTDFPRGSPATYSVYALQTCGPGGPEPPGGGGGAIQSGDFRTESHVSWGASPSGGNTAAYRDANFDAAFPTGLIVGGVNTAQYTSSIAVQAALPTGGTPGALARSYINPFPSMTGEASEAGGLLGQVVALTLNVVFDLYDPSFCGSAVSLKDLIVTSGDCAGMTVDRVLAEANTVLGGGSSSFGPAQIYECVVPINDSFAGGVSVSGHLSLP